MSNRDPNVNPSEWAPQEDTFNTGPFAMLIEVVKSNDSVIEA